MIRRALAPHILDALRQFPVVFVNGPRQAGKSTLVQQLAEKKWPAEYITFDEATMLGAAEANPESFLRSYQHPLILDEVQLAPGLFRVLKIMADEARKNNKTDANGRYLLTGSANIMALPGLSDALVGRMNILTLYPLSALEVSKGKGGFLPAVMENRFRPGKTGDGASLPAMIRQATFPEITRESTDHRRRWFESYITTILQRDVRQLAEIEKMGVLPNLLRILAGRTGGLINEADIARSVGQNAVTTKNYRLLLQMIFLTFDVRPWFRNTGKRLVKSAKGYLVDTSLLCHLQKIDLEAVAVREPETFGRVMENFVASELIKQLAASDFRAELYHFRTSDNKEVDFVLEQPDGRIAALEVKARDAVTERDFKGLKVLRDLVKKDFICGAVLYTGRQTVSYGDNLWAVPVKEMWK